MRWECPLRIALWLLALTLAVIGVANMIAMVVNDLPGDYVEGVVLTAQNTINNGGAIYAERNWSSSPYSINLYGPVFYELGALSGRFGPETSLIPGRLLAIASLALAFAALWRLEREWLGLGFSDALLGILLSLGSLPVVVFGAQYRVDALAIAFGLWGLVFAFRGQSSLFISPVLFVLAVYTKPTAITAVLAVGIWWIFQRKWREIGIVIGECLVFGTIPLIVLSVTTDHAFTRSLFEFNALPFSLGGWLHAAQGGLAGGLLALGCAAAVTFLITGNDQQRLVSIYLLAAASLSFLMIGRVGANFNYFIEPALLMGPVIACAWSRIKTEQYGTIAGASLLTAILACSLLWVGPRVVTEFRGRLERSAVEKKIACWIAAEDTVLTTEIVSALRLDADLYLNDPSIFARLAESGLWNQNPMLKDLETGVIQWVLADEDMTGPMPGYSNWTRETRAVVADHFELVEYISRFHLYKYVPFSRHLEHHAQQGDGRSR